MMTKRTAWLPLLRKVVAMVTYTELFTFCLVVIAIIELTHRVLK